MSAHRTTGSLVLATVLTLAAPSLVGAHCDTLGGPVVADARVALESGGVEPVLKWVGPGDETAVRAAFDRAVSVRALGDEARELADTYFLETLVRIHRASEGAPYTGLKPAGSVEPAVALADQALETGSSEALSAAITDHVADGIQTRFERAAEARQHADDSVAAGREYVAAYVELTHFVEGLHQMAAGAAAHHEHTVQ